MSKCMGCTTILARTFSWFCAVVTSDKTGMLPLKIGLPNLGVYYGVYKQLSGLLPDHYRQEFLDSFIFFSGFTHEYGSVFEFCK